MSSTLQIQTDPKIKGAGIHVGTVPLVVDDAGNVDGDLFEIPANKEGYSAFWKIDPGHYFILVRAEGYEDARAEVDMPHDELLTVPLTPLKESGTLDTRPHPTSLYWEFTNQGKPWQFRGYTTHTLLCSIKKGEDITPLLNEAKGYGGNTLITIGTHLSQWKKDHGFYLNPLDSGYQDLLASLFDQTAESGLRVAHAVLADVQSVSRSDQQRIWDLSSEVMKGRWNVLPRIGNEWTVNGWYPADFTRHDTGGSLDSRGSVGVNEPPFQDYWRWAEWESRRGPLYKAMDDNGAGCLELNHGYGTSGGGSVGPFRCPVVVIEPAFFNDTTPDGFGDDRWTSPDLALMMGMEIGSNSAGGGFGSSQSLICQPNGSIAAECARQFFRGLKATFLR